jgi:hypothetical protein
MDNDFNTADALAAVFSLVSRVNARSTGRSAVRPGESESPLEALSSMDRVLGCSKWRMRRAPWTVPWRSGWRSASRPGGMPAAEGFRRRRRHPRGARREGDRPRGRADGDALEGCGRMTLGGPREVRPEPTMWQQFRRRRVIRTVVLYLAFVVLATELYLFAAQFVAFPPWGFRAVVGVAVLGFPFTVVLAWTYDVTPTGIVRTPDELGAEPPPPPPATKRGWVIASVAALLVALALRLLRA